MKRLGTIIVLLASLAPLKAQDCTGFFPMTEGVQMEMTYYDKKGKETNVSKSTIEKIVQQGNVYLITIHVQMTDEKGKDMSDVTMTAKCENGNFEMDLSEFMDQKTRESLEGMQFKITGDKVYLPADLSVGQKLPDAEMIMSTDGALKMKATFTNENRKVEKKEKVTVPAGTYDCFLITSSQNLKMIANTENTMKQWVNKEVGLVMVEVYSRNGKLLSTQKLTGITMP